MPAFDAGFDEFHAEREAENAAQQRELENKRQQVGILFNILNDSAARLLEAQLSPIAREGELHLTLGDDNFAAISPSAAGDLFEIRVGSEAQTFSGDTEGCIKELGKMVAKALFARSEADRKARLAAKRRPSSGGWMAR